MGLFAARGRDQRRRIIFIFIFAPRLGVSANGLTAGGEDDCGGDATRLGGCRRSQHQKEEEEMRTGMATWMADGGYRWRAGWGNGERDQTTGNSFDGGGDDEEKKKGEEADDEEGDVKGKREM